MAGGTGLHLPGAAVLLANAVWTPDPAHLDEVGPWCHERGIPPALIVRGDARGGHEAARRRGLAATMAFVPVPVAPAPSAPADDAPAIEQVGFARGAAIGVCLARHYRQPEQAVAIGTAVADALRRDGRLQAWLAWTSDGASNDPSGALVAFAPVERGAGPDAPPWDGLLIAGDPPVQRALRQRFADEAAAAGRGARLWRARTPRGRLEARAWVRLEAVERAPTETVQ